MIFVISLTSAVVVHATHHMTGTSLNGYGAFPQHHHQSRHLRGLEDPPPQRKQWSGEQESIESKLRGEPLTERQLAEHLVENNQRLLDGSDGQLAQYAKKQLNLAKEFEACVKGQPPEPVKSWWDKVLERSKMFKKLAAEVTMAVSSKQRGNRRDIANPRRLRDLEGRGEPTACGSYMTKVEKLQDEYIENWLSQGEAKWIRNIQEHRVSMKPVMEHMAKVFAKMVVRESQRPRRATTTHDTSDKGLWDVTAPIKYYIETRPETGQNLAGSNILHFKNALKMWSESTCLEFEEVKEPSEVARNSPLIFVQNTKPSVKINQKWRSCFTDGSGMPEVGRGNRNIFGRDCVSARDFAHEIGHVIGLEHTQQRPDRDNYLELDVDTDDSKWNYNSKIFNWDFVKDFGLPFDYDSIMLYATALELRTAKGQDEEETTTTMFYIYKMCPTDPRHVFTMGRGEELSHHDKALVNKMYCTRECLPEEKLRDVDFSRTKMTSGFKGGHCFEWARLFSEQKELSLLSLLKNTCLNDKANPDPRGPFCYVISTKIDGYDEVSQRKILRSANLEKYKAYCIESCPDRDHSNNEKEAGIPSRQGSPDIDDSRQEHSATIRTRRNYCENYCVNGGYLDFKADQKNNAEGCQNCKCPKPYTGKHCEIGPEQESPQYQAFLEEKYPNFRIIKLPRSTSQTILVDSSTIYGGRPPADSVNGDSLNSNEPHVKNGYWIMALDANQKILISFTEVDLWFKGSCTKGDYMIINSNTCPKKIGLSQLHCNYAAEQNDGPAVTTTNLKIHYTSIPPVASTGPNLVVLLRIKHWPRNSPQRLHMLVQSVPDDKAKMIRQRLGQTPDWLYSEGEEL